MRPCFAAIVIAVLSGAVVHAQTDVVRILESDANAAVLGTDAFSLRVDRTGAISQVMVDETELCWLIRLYTSPVVPETGERLRAVQGEVSRGGIGPAPETIVPEIRGENGSIFIRRTCSREEIDGAAPLYELAQAVTVHPSGLINLHYEFDWLHVLDMPSANLIIALRAAPLDGCLWNADLTTQTMGGIIDAAPEATSIALRNTTLRTFTARCPDGDLDLWLNASGPVSARRWNQDDYAFFVTVPHTGHEGPIYPGVRSVIDVDLKLPVPRED